jgi:putative nucleotidyltransferase with HDIG domain
MGEASQSNRPKMLFCNPSGSFLDWSEEIKRVGCDWVIERVDYLQSGLEILAGRQFDAIVVAAPATPDRELGYLRQVMQAAPHCVRILYTPVLSSNYLVKALDVVHRVCLNSNSLQETISLVEQAIASNRMLSADKVRRSMAAFKQLPSPPSIFHELTRQLNSERTTSQHIATVVAKDPALTARLLRIVNSSYFGLRNPVSNIQQAVTLIGTRTLRGLALAGHFGRHYKSAGGWTLFSLEGLQARSLMVARLAQALAKVATKDPLVRDQAFLAGLLLDIGMVMLATEQAEAYGKIFGYAAKHRVALNQVEIKAFGVTHAQLGANLLTQWNLPPMVVDAVLYHHNPADYFQNGLTPVAIAHAADALLPALDNRAGVQINAQLDRDFLICAGLDELLPKWKMEANGFRLQAKKSAIN